MTMVGCALAHEPAVTTSDGGTPLPSDGSAACATGLAWLDRAPIALTRTRFAQPAITGDGDGFLVVTSDRRPAGIDCAGAPCVAVERIAPSGAVTREQDVALGSERLWLFASTDLAGRGHLAAASQAPATECCTQGWTAGTLVWGEPGRLHRTELDTSRGLAAVALDGERAWIVTHGWRPESTIGEGFSYPIEPRISIAEADGSTHEERPIDPTDGEIFARASLSIAGASDWILTEDFYGRAPGVASAAQVGSTLEIEGWSPRCALVAEPAGSAVVACAVDGHVHVLRVEDTGERTSGPALEADPGWPALARSADGDRLALAVVHGDEVEITVLGRSLEVLAHDVAPIPHGLDGASLALAAAADGSFALMAVPFPRSSDFEAAEPIWVSRFRVCGG